MSDALSRPWHLKVPRERSRPLGAKSPYAVAMVGLLALFAVIVAAASAVSGSGSGSTKTAGGPAKTVSPATWIDIVKPVQIFSLEAPALGHVAPAYTARRWSAGGGREDTMAFGTATDDQPMVRLKILRGHGETKKTPLFAATARQAAEADLSIERSGLPGLLPTRFGRFEIADVDLSGAPSRRPLPCSGFRLVLDQPDLSITGLACDGRAGFPRKVLACLIDRLDLASAGDDKALVDFFAASELHRGSECAGTRLGPDQLHAAWLDDKPATPKKHLRRH